MGVHRDVYRVFLSSPGDVLAERNRASAVIDRLNAEHPGHPVFALTRWEESFYTATHTFQDQITSPGEHHLVIFIFWKKLGTDLPPQFNRADGTSRTGTEYEFEEARDARERRADNLPDILVYRKSAKILFSEEFLEVERAQKKSLDQFWERWFRTSTGHFIAGFQSFGDPADFDRQLESNLREWLRRQHLSPISWHVDRQGSPYRGLNSFDEQHSGLFFGRDADIGRARARFIEAAIGPDTGRRGAPFLLILGASGSGKSSFLRAGLIPRMRAAGAPAFREDGSDGIHGFKTLTLIPREMGDDLCNGLAAALYGTPGSRDDPAFGLRELADGDYRTPSEFAALARTSPDSAIAPVLSALDRASYEVSKVEATEGSPRQIGLLLAIDQLEELFARTAADREAFARLLGSLVSTGRVWIVATMRNDFYDRLRQDLELSALSDRGRVYDLAPPVVADYREIIRRPAQAAGLRFEINQHRDLAAEIEAEAGSDGALPMIAFLLEQLFRERRGDLLTLETYDRLGGAAGALAEHGDEVLNSLAEKVRSAFPRVVRRLVRKSLQDLAPTANPASIKMFSPGSPERTLVDALADARLICAFTVFDSATEPSNAWVRWSHEALLTRWPRLRNAVDAERRDYETLDRIHDAYSLWLGSPIAQRRDRLLSDLALAEAEDLFTRWYDDIDPPLRDFVQASGAASKQRRRRRRRNVSAIIASLSALTVVASITSIIAYQKRNRAMMEQEAADRTTNFMVDLFKVADPGETRGNAITVREMLDRGAVEAEHGLDTEPAIRADLRTAMGQAYAGLGLYDPAKKLLADADRDQNGIDVSAESRVRTLVALGSTLYLTADYDKAAQLLRNAVAIARKQLPTTSELRSEALDDLADVDVQEDNDTEAEALCLEALAADRQRGEEHLAALARTLDALGRVYLDRGSMPDAEKAMREALDLRIKTSGRNDAMTAQAMNNLAAVLYLSGKYEENVVLLEQALPVYEDIYGREHPDVAILLNNMGRSALMAGNLDKAAPLLRRALELTEKLEGPTHDDLVLTLNSLAMIDSFEGRLADATLEISRAEEIARMPDHGKILDQVLLNAAEIHVKNGNVAKATASLAESRRVLEATFPLATRPTEAWRYAVWDTVNAELLARKGDETGARSAIANALPTIVKRFGDKGFYTVLAQRRGLLVEDQFKHAKTL